MKLGLPLTEQEKANRYKLSLEKPAVYRKVMQYDSMLAAGKSTALIQLQYSYDCNFYCSHCSISGFRKNTDKGPRLTPGVVGILMDRADEYGLAHVALTGGEPLVFPDLFQVLKAIGTTRFHTQVDTNGWHMTLEMATKLKDSGVDKIQVSIDGLEAKEHDAFRRKKGSHKRTLLAVENSINAGLSVQVATVVDHARAQSDELEKFLSAIRLMGASPTVVYAKPVGEWAGRDDVLCAPDDIKHVKELLAKYGGYDHTTPCYGQDLGCIAAKRMISILANGDVMPCPWMLFKLGNVFDEPLADILDKGMRYLGDDYSPVCRMSESPAFRKKYLSKIKDAQFPVPIEQVMEPK